MKNLHTFEEFLNESTINEGDLTRQYDGFIAGTTDGKIAYKIRYQKGRNSVQVENDAFAKLMKQTGKSRGSFWVTGLIKKGEWDKTEKPELNESNLNEALTVKDYIQMAKQDGDRDWVKIAQNCIKLLKVEEKGVYWITSEDDDPKWDEIYDMFNGSENVTKNVFGHTEGPDGRGSAFYFDNKIPMIKYEAQGIETFLVPKAVYDTL